MPISYKPFVSFLFLLLILAAQTVAVDETKRQPYIVYLGDAREGGLASVGGLHHDILSAATGSRELAEKSMVHSYGRSFNAFAARLSQEEAMKLSDMDEVVSVFPNGYKKLHTTRSWDFLGLSQKAKRMKFESNVIVALLDSGISPSSESFNDRGFGPVPSKWKGKCVLHTNFTGCNRKLIGANYYKIDGTPSPPETNSPADFIGHGTHTASTAAGVAVGDASLYGLSRGTARGGVPAARIAMYKVCWADSGCSDIDILAGFDDAIADGVDIISVSLGGGVFDYFKDPISIGAFHAMRRGILTSCSAGNDGPFPMSVGNISPWILTVAASSTDRQFRTAFGLGNGKKITGISINTFSPKKRIYPLISGAQAANHSADDSYGSPSSCNYGTLDTNKVKGKILYCDMVFGGVDISVKDSGGLGAIIRSESPVDTAFSFIIPATVIDDSQATTVSHYINTTRNPQAVIYKTRTIKAKAPVITSFSSRGPNSLTPHILKPDICAPGLDILAAYSPLTSVTGFDADKRIVNYNILSGTSMSCPHVSGAAAYVKSFHPSWSPAAIKSALMTTAREMSSKVHKDAEFAYGAGQIDPTRAVHPGLIYDANEMSYVRFLCKEGYNGTSLGLITGGTFTNCPPQYLPAGSDGLNYPSMIFEVKDPQRSFSTVFRRTVTNVGTGKSVYRAIIKTNAKLSITVSPRTLTFTRLYQKRSFKVVVKGGPLDHASLLSASLVWDDSRHRVRSPIVVTQKIHFF